MAPPSDDNPFLAIALDDLLGYGLSVFIPLPPESTTTATEWGISSRVKCKNTFHGSFRDQETLGDRWFDRQKYWKQLLLSFHLKISNVRLCFLEGWNRLLFPWNPFDTEVIDLRQSWSGCTLSTSCWPPRITGFYSSLEGARWSSPASHVAHLLAP